ncbi:uncharacterized protein BO97DRAFT_440485 [Aspergillus homomorphus CBS 101889]|uniref:protein S-acyltransferase n=1 Tax=Aspergillus homomorphus (strain CBS 101889) TaxID=1450537 RepID=A0A395I6S5_ASPHC|nr:hypothetical protein BO97DRAFT_440485 [Aspergillus homomorphus CBS 101889]RAL15870.1 hypothetical protein BO97DRAFT_440485 [Aspergillus homomorphus CBS 101889]
MGLLDLPVELLLQISSYMDEHDIASLIRTSRAVHNLLENELYRHHIARTNGVALLWAAKHGKEQLVHKLLDHGADIEIGGRTGTKEDAQSRWCARTSDRYTLLWVFAGNRQMVWMQKHRQTALSIAAQHGQASTVRALLARGAQIDAPDCRNRSTLVNTIAEIVDRRHRKNRNDPVVLSGPVIITPLQPIMEALLADDRALKSGYGYNALTYALRSGDEDICMYMLQEESTRATFAQQHWFYYLVCEAAHYGPRLLLPRLLTIADTYRSDTAAIERLAAWAKKQPSCICVYPKILDPYVFLASLEAYYAI